MTDLHEKNCIPCRGGIPPFDISEIHKYLKKVDCCVYCSYGNIKCPPVQKGECC